ncbi:major capsid protein [Pseudoalteromonas sp. Of7M-16]|uniref:major capsid protein n=1 Tax=Pseudoalteromonas sp. Of7M-16 TaxID=2917756 RepID=UPI001EF5B14C|nr:major capsid protein [Pseudoalteromonas sp. Of7M-16]MCG7551363.1 major capsid protein [Pseudoalteromonas sp. Of7M-16]
MLYIAQTLKTVQGFLTPQHIALRISKQKPINQTIRNWLFGNAVQHHFAHIAISELQQVLNNVPVVRRGTSAYNIGSDGKSMELIEPQGIDIIDGITAKDLNDMRMLSTSSIQQIVDQKTDKMMKIVSKSAEALCSQAITGQIAYPMKTDAGMDTYEVNFGDPNKHVSGKKWDSADITATKVYDVLMEMTAQIEQNGFGSKVEFKAGKKAFSALLAIAEKSTSKAIKVEIKDNTIYIGGIGVTLENGTYLGVNKAITKKVPDHEVVAVDVEAGHGFWWLALDDLKAGLIALPFFPSQNLNDNPSQLEIIGRSKPLPGPVVPAICWASVVEEPAPAQEPAA